MQFQKYIFAAILLTTICSISAKVKCRNDNELCNCAGDLCEDHCEYKSFMEFQKNKTSCVCKPGFARSSNGNKCIPAHKCECAPNEFLLTHSDNIAKSCDYLCKCDPNHYRENGICVPCEYPREYMDRCIEFNIYECSCSKCDDASKLCKGNCRQNHLNCKNYDMKRCECTLCDNGYKLNEGKCNKEKCTITCKQDEIKDLKACVCKSCPNGQIACNGNCVDYPKHCSMFQVNQCKCVQCENEYVLEHGNCVPKPPPLCPPKETYYCGSKCPRTCAQPTGNNICEEECQCVCIDGLVRNETGQCIHPNKCTCKANEAYGKYDSTCIATCTNPNPRNCASIIKIGCNCLDGYVLDTKSKTCVLYEDCPAPICPKNEEYQSCGTACPPTCDVPGPTACTKQCVSGCFCKKGFFRDLNDNQCVEMKNCSCSFANTQFCLCGPEEPATCNNPFVDNDNDCYDNRPGCYCTKGTIRDTQTGQCVQPEHCTCKRDEVYKSCGTACEPTCLEPVAEICIDLCVPGCFCRDGYVRNEFGDCVPLFKCTCPPNEINSTEGCICRPGYERDLYYKNCVKVEEHSCSLPNEEYSECGTNCPLSCDNMNPRLCNFLCKPGCFCVNGTIRDDSGFCVKPEECCKLSNEKYFDCYLEHPKGECSRGCFCINGTKRDPISRQCVSSSEESCQS